MEGFDDILMVHLPVYHTFSLREFHGEFRAADFLLLDGLEDHLLICMGSSQVDARCLLLADKVARLHRLVDLFDQGWVSGLISQINLPDSGQF